MSSLKLGAIDLQAVLQSIREVAADPSSNLTLSVLLLGLVSLLLLIVVVAVLFYLAGMSDDEAETEASAALPDDESRPAHVPTKDRTWFGLGSARSRAVLLAASAVAIPVLLIGSAVAGYVVTSSDGYCVRCHGDKVLSSTSPKGETDSSDLHGTVRCIACHEDGAFAAITNIGTRAGEVVAYFSGGRAREFSGATPSARCLRCHQGIESGAILLKQRGIRVSHAEFLRSGMECSECHPNTGHVAAARSAGMSNCVRCHDDKRASAKCSVCHIGDTARASSQRRLFVPQTIIKKGDCGGCHDQRSCDNCHGIRMPHTIAFVSGEHARKAGFDKKTLCFGCHAVNECGKCHKINAAGVWGHPQNWKSEHMKVSRGEVAGCGCHGRSPYVQQGKDYCLACHSPGIR